MCLINTEIENVSNNKILVAPNADKTRQIIIYSNYINNISESNAMIIPVPLPHTIKFINLGNYNNIFEECEKCFYNPNKLKSFNYSTNTFNTREDSLSLDVFNIENYKVSLAMNLDQLSKVDKNIFELNNNLKQILEMYYYQPYWGFIICKLDIGIKFYHPFAFSHEIIDNKIYIPTRNYHHKIKWTDSNQWALGSHIDPKHNPLNANNWNENNIDESPMFKTDQLGKSAQEVNGWSNMLDKDLLQNNKNNNTNTNFIAKISSKYDNFKKNNNNKLKQEYNLNTYKNIIDDWSITIYLLNINPFINKEIKQMNSNEEIWDKQSVFNLDQINFNFGQCHNFSKIKINGTNNNIDFVIPI
jgi:hypothetical protein